MGKKSRKTSGVVAAVEPNGPKSKAVAACRLSPEKFAERQQLVASLLQMSFIATTTPPDQWLQYVNMHAILERIRTVESDIDGRAGGNSRPTRQQNVARFKQWAAANGARFDSIDIAEFAGYQLGLVARRPIAPDSLFVTVPKRMCLTLDKESPVVRRLADALPIIADMPNVRLALAVLVERLQEQQSFWAPYLNVLPERYSTVLAYAVDDMGELRGSSALSVALKQCRSIGRQYAIILSRLQKIEDDDDDALMRLLRDNFTYKLYCWAVSTVMTRQNCLPCDSDRDEALSTKDAEPLPPQHLFSVSLPALIPLWDMANHAHGHLTNVYNAKERRVEGGAMRAFAKDEQIFIYYGQRRNSNFLVHNGFVCADNHDDSVAIHIGFNSADPLLTQRTLLLQRLGLRQHDELLVLPAPLFISGDLLAFVRVFNMNAKQLQLWLDADRNADDLRLESAKDLDATLAKQSWNFLRIRLMLLLRAFPQTLAEDEALLEQQRKHRLSLFRSIIVQYRVLEKRMLTAALEFVSNLAK